MIEVIILTSSTRGSAAVQLEELLKSKEIKVKSVVLNQGQITNKKKYYKRKLNKTLKIGVFGALNGIRMRKWYSSGALKYLANNSIDDLCNAHNIPINITPSINCSQTIEYFEKTNADIGLSLGNGYIGSRIFSIPKWGMINIHHEELPAYQNAQSIIWQLYNNSRNTSYTIHKIDTRIDAGDILFKETIPITFRDDLGDTISFNYAELFKKSAKGLVKVLNNLEAYFEESIPQAQGKSYTTPSLWQYLVIKKNFKTIKQRYAANNAR